MGTIHIIPDADVVVFFVASLAACFIILGCLLLFLYYVD